MAVEPYWIPRLCQLITIVQSLALNDIATARWQCSVPRITWLYLCVVGGSRDVLILIYITDLYKTADTLKQVQQKKKKYVLFKMYKGHIQVSLLYSCFCEWPYVQRRDSLHILHFTVLTCSFHSKKQTNEQTSIQILKYVKGIQHLIVNVFCSVTSYAAVEKCNLYFLLPELLFTE